MNRQDASSDHKSPEPNYEHTHADAAVQGATICIHHGGRCFVTTEEYAGIFLRGVQRVVDRHAGELIPLLHHEGVDLLFVESSSPLQVHDSRDNRHACC